MDSPGNVSVTSCPRENSPGHLTSGSNVHERQVSPNKPTPGGGRPRPPRPAKPPVAQKPAVSVKPVLNLPKSSHNDLPKGTPPALPSTPPRGNVKMSPKCRQVPRVLPKSSEVPGTKATDSSSLQLASFNKKEEKKVKDTIINNNDKPDTLTSDGKVCLGITDAKDKTNSKIKDQKNEDFTKNESDSVQAVARKDTTTSVESPRICNNSTMASTDIHGTNLRTEDKIPSKDSANINTFSKEGTPVNKDNIVKYETGKSAITISYEQFGNSSFFIHSDHLYSEIPENLSPETKTLKPSDDRPKINNQKTFTRIISSNQKSLHEEVCKRLKSRENINKDLDQLPPRPVPKIRNSLGKSRQESDTDLSSDSSCLIDMMTSRSDIPDLTAKSPCKQNNSLTDSLLSSSLSLNSHDTTTSSFETSVSSIDTENSIILSKPCLDISDSSSALLCKDMDNVKTKSELLASPNAQMSPSDTCNMLKEIEDLLNKKLAEVSLTETSDMPEYCEPPLEDVKELEQSDCLNENILVPRRHSMGPSVLEKTNVNRYSLSSTPMRPPRPKRAASKKMKQLSIDLNSGSSGSTESLDSNIGESTGTLKKRCPPKPKRTTLPRVGRSQSDVTGMKNYVDEVSNNPPPVPKRPVFGTPDIPPPLPPRNKPQNMCSSCSNSSEDVSSTKISGQAELIKTVLVSQKDSPPITQVDGEKPRPLRKAPPPPKNPPSLSRLKGRQTKLQQSKSIDDKTKCSDTTGTEKARKISNQESKGFLACERDPLIDEDLMGHDLDTRVPLSLNVSKESSDHDYHEISDSLVADYPPSPTRVKSPPPILSTLKESSPPPQLPPRTYRDSTNSLAQTRPTDQSVESVDSIESSKSEALHSGSDTTEKSPEDGVSDSNKPGYLDMSGSSTPQSDKSRPISNASQQSSYSESGSLENNQNDMSSDSESDSENEETIDAKRKRKAFLTAKEIMTSEMVFVDVLKLLNVEFRVAMSKAMETSDKPVISNEVLNKILDFLPQLQNFNEDLLRDLNERIQKWDEHQRVADIFVKKGPFLKMYSTYIKNFTNAISIFDDALKKNPAFAAAVRQFESTPRCASLALKHHMLKPIQRIPQYRLLLQDYLKHLNKDDEDYENTINALAIVGKVADHADQSTRQGDDVQKLLEIQNALIGQFEVIQPGRELIKCGELMKLSRKELQPRMFFLFNDVLLYTVSVASGYKLNQILPVNGMKVSKPIAEDFKNEFSILSVQRSFTVAASTPEERDDWLKTLTQAIEESAQRKYTFQTVKLHATPQTSLLDKDFVVGHKAPLMVPDARVTMCMLCLGEFTMTWRRHHCRACGRVICGNCSENKAPLKYLEFKSARVCSECYTKIESEINKGDIDIKNDEMDGTTSAPLSLSSIKTRFEKIRKSARSNKGVIKRPAVLKEVRANDEGSDMSGYLKSCKNKKWKKMWYVLKDKVLYTYRASEDMAAVESLPLLGYEVTRVTNYFEGVEPDLVFHIIHPNTPPLIFRTDSAAATSKWIYVLREASVP